MAFRHAAIGERGVDIEFEIAFGDDQPGLGRAAQDELPFLFLTAYAPDSIPAHHGVPPSVTILSDNVFSSSSDSSITYGLTAAAP